MVTFVPFQHVQQYRSKLSSRKSTALDCWLQCLKSHDRIHSMASSCIRGGLNWKSGRIPLQKGWSGCPWRWWNLHLWRYSRHWMWHLGTQFRGRFVTLRGWLHTILKVFSSFFCTLIATKTSGFP